MIEVLVVMITHILREPMTWPGAWQARNKKGSLSGEQQAFRIYFCGPYWAKLFTLSIRVCHQ